MRKPSNSRSLRGRVALALVVPFVLLLSACTLENHIVIQADESVSFSVKVEGPAADFPLMFGCAKLKESISQPPLNIKDLEVTDNSSGSNISCLVKTTKPLPFEEAKKQIFGEMVFKHENGFFIIESKGLPPMPGGKEKVKNELSKLKLSLKFEFPGEVVDPGPGVANGNVVEVTDPVKLLTGYKIKAADKPAVAHIFNAKNSGFSWGIVALIVFLIIVIIGAVVGAIFAMRKKPAVPASNAGYYSGPHGQLMPGGYPQPGQGAPDGYPQPGQGMPGGYPQPGQGAPGTFPQPGASGNPGGSSNPPTYRPQQ